MMAPTARHEALLLSRTPRPPRAGRSCGKAVEGRRGPGRAQPGGGRRERDRPALRAGESAADMAVEKRFRPAFPGSLSPSGPALQ